MSTINSKNVQVGTSGTAAQNFTLYQPATPDGTVRLGVGNSGATTSDVVTVNSSGVTVTGVVAVPAGSAAAPSISPTGDTNTGVFFPSADTIAFAEGGVEVGRFDSSANFQFNSGYGSSATAYGCRAWVNFNGTGTVAIRASGNVSSITDNGTGDYTVNLTTAMSDANYAAQVCAMNNASNNFISSVYQNSALVGSVRMYVGTTASLTDSAAVYVAIFR